MTKRRKMTRREFLQVSALMTVGVAAAACGGGAATPAAEEKATEVPVAEGKEEEPTAAPSGYSEAPSLAAMVAAGKLPPVEERLPLEPFVVGPGVRIVEEDLPDWEPGVYSKED